MHPITVTQFANQRIHELQSVADRIRQERAMRAAPPAGQARPPTGPAETRRLPAKPGRTSPVERAT